MIFLYHKSFTLNMENIRNWEESLKQWGLRAIVFINQCPKLFWPEETLIFWMRSAISSKMSRHPDFLESAIITSSPMSTWYYWFTNLAILHGFPSNPDTMRHFGWDTQIFEVTLMRWPELTPHWLAHSMFCLQEICCYWEGLSGLNPLKNNFICESFPKYHISECVLLQCE